MDTEKIMALTTETVDQRSEELIKEFQDHFHEYARLAASNGESANQRIVFEGWIIQKVASIQVILEAYVEAMGIIGNREHKTN